MTKIDRDVQNILVSLTVTQVSDYFAYILQCSDGTLYTGWTRDLEQRLLTHNSGKGAKYTRVRLPVSLLASWCFDNKIDAMRMEYAIKKLPRKTKLELIADPLNSIAQIEKLQELNLRFPPESALPA